MRPTPSVARLLLAGAAVLVIASATATAQTATEPDATEPDATSEPGGDQRPPDGPEVTATSIANGLGVPVALAAPDDGSGRRFVVDQTGPIRIIDGDDRLLDEPFLDLTDRLVELDPNYDERGALGIAFHPEFEENGRVYVYYSAPARDGIPEGWDHTSHLAEFRVDADNPNRAAPDSERIVLRVDQPYSNHNAGQIAFGQDGMLYVPLGDGGNGNDRDDVDDDLRPRPERGNAQTPSNLLGSVLRLDVDGEQPYAAPDDNPFVDDDRYRPEIWAYGLRNPFGLSVDRETGDLYVAEAGQALFEEMNRLEAGGNFGWNIKEGTSCFNPDDATSPPSDCPDEGRLGEPLVDPVVEYRRGPETGSVVIPGVRYRGERIPELRDQLVFGDYSRVRFRPDGVIYAAEEQDEGTWPMRTVRVAGAQDGRSDGELNRFLLSISQDAEGELYALVAGEGGPTGGTGEVLALSAAGGGEAEDETGTAWWWIAVGVGALALAGLTVAVLRARRGRGDAPQDG